MHCGAPGTLMREEPDGDLGFETIPERSTGSTSARIFCSTPSSTTAIMKRGSKGTRRRVSFKAVLELVIDQGGDTGCFHAAHVDGHTVRDLEIDCFPDAFL